jgi:hypothetical protein
MDKKASAGKGDSPRNCFSKQFKDNYDLINWSKHKQNENININMSSDNRVRAPEQNSD